MKAVVSRKDAKTQSQSSAEGLVFGFSSDFAVFGHATPWPVVFPVPGQHHEALSGSERGCDAPV